MAFFFSLSATGICKVSSCSWLLSDGQNSIEEMPDMRTIFNVVHIFS